MGRKTAIKDIETIKVNNQISGQQVQADQPKVEPQLITTTTIHNHHTEEAASKEHQGCKSQRALTQSLQTIHNEVIDSKNLILSLARFKDQAIMGTLSINS